MRLARSHRCVEIIIMRTIILVLGIFLFVPCGSSFSQQPSPAKNDPALVGVWQVGSPKIISGDGIMANWRFFPGGKFKYSLRDGGLDPLKSISGIYYVDGQGLHAKIQQFEAITDYKDHYYRLSNDPDKQF